jgi:hypothetical protein
MGRRLCGTQRRKVSKARQIGCDSCTVTLRLPQALHELTVRPPKDIIPHTLRDLTTTAYSGPFASSLAVCAAISVFAGG